MKYLNVYEFGDFSAYADAYKDAGKPVTKVGINFNVENEANFTEWVIK